MTPKLSPLDQVRRHLFQMKLHSLQRRNVPAPPLESLPLPFVLVTAPYVAFPAAGAAAILLLSYTVPAGQNTIITLLSVFAVGGNFVNGSGTAIWRVLINDAGVKGLQGMQSQFGSDSLPLSVAIPMVENDTIKITVEVPNGQVAPTGTTGARIHGGSAPAAIATLAGLGQSSSSSTSISSVTPTTTAGSSPSPTVNSSYGGGNNKLPQM